MGYYTDYTLMVHDIKPEDERFKELSYYITEEIGMEVWCEDVFSCNAKWYDHDDELRKLSAEYPDVLFELHGEGEDSGDLWNTYYKNGKLQHCPAEIVYPDYDESKLR